MGRLPIRRGNEHDTQPDVVKHLTSIAYWQCSLGHIMEHTRSQLLHLQKRGQWLQKYRNVVEDWAGWKRLRTIQQSSWQTFGIQSRIIPFLSPSVTLRVFAPVPGFLKAISKDNNYPWPTSKGTSHKHDLQSTKCNNSCIIRKCQGILSLSHTAMA